MLLSRDEFFFQYIRFLGERMEGGVKSHCFLQIKKKNAQSGNIRDLNSESELKVLVTPSCGTLCNPTD